MRENIIKIVVIILILIIFVIISVLTYSLAVVSSSADKIIDEIMEEKENE